MKIAVMQPYFFPYLGYFQLIKCVDVFVNLDHVSYMKSSYMTRNILHNNIPINISVINGSQNRKCKDVIIDKSDYLIRKLKRKLELTYKNSISYDEVLNEIIYPWISYIENQDNPSISSINRHSTKLIMKYLDINTRYIDTSEGITQNKSAEGQIDIVKEYGGNVYVNPIGGKTLYSKNDFHKEGLELQFLQMKDNAIDDPYFSILHHLFRYQRETLIDALNNYKLK